VTRAAIANLLKEAIFWAQGVTMRKATRVITASLGLFAGFGGLEHGYFEILQGNVRPGSILIASMDPPCVPEATWHACEPAMTVVPNFLVTGILAMALGLLTMVWAAAYVHRPQGGAILALLSLGLLLFGGGIFPPLIGIIGGVTGTRINAGVNTQPGSVWRTLAKLWPWILVVFFVLLFGQFPIGFLNNDSMPLLIPVVLLGLLVLSLLAGYGHRIQEQGRAET
jgi:hypothetical protein